MVPQNPDSGHTPALRGQRLHIPDLRPAFAAWKQGVNPLYGRVRLAVDARLEGLIPDARVLAKVKAADIALFAAGWFPDAPYHILETAAFYCVWLFLWDDAIDGAGAGAEAEAEGLLAEEYCRQSVAFVEYHLGIVGRREADASEPPAPTAVCASFAEVGGRVAGYAGPEDRGVLGQHLREYMEACVTEHRWRLSGRVPSVEEFYSWRLRTSSVDVMLDLSRILNGLSLPVEILESKELADMGLKVNKLLILINEVFSLKKELKDGAFGNLIPITMRSLGVDLDDAVQKITQDIYDCITDFDHNAARLQERAARENGHEAADRLNKLIEAYQAIAATVLNFSVQSPRYGLLKDRQEDGSFVVLL